MEGGWERGGVDDREGWGFANVGWQRVIRAAVAEQITLVMKGDGRVQGGGCAGGVCIISGMGTEH